MFDTEPYQEYVTLCRELRLERDFEEGDWYAAYDDLEVLGVYIRLVTEDAMPGFSTVAWSEVRWLPRLDQWLSKLEEAGVRNVAFQTLSPTESSPFEELGGPLRPIILPPDAPRYGCIDLNQIGDVKRAWPYGACREEACARLWLAVTGRVVTA